MIDAAFVASIHWEFGAPELSSWQGAGPFVYFIRSGDVVKIGWSATPELRADQLRRGGHALRPTAGLVEDPILLAYIPGSERDEATLHERFSATHDRGEWFHSTPELEALIDASARIQCELEVHAHIASYEARVELFGWPARTHDREVLVQQQLTNHHNAARRAAA